MSERSSDASGRSTPTATEGAWLTCAEAAARAAGQHAVTHLRRRSDVVEIRKHDVKLQLDLECQAVAEGVIRGCFPDHAIMGEEGGEGSGDESPTWIIDPIDGTVNFYHGLPNWCVSIGVQCEGETWAGCVYVPIRDECYTATRSGPALCNGVAIEPARTEDLTQAVVLTGFARDAASYPYTLPLLDALGCGVQKVRMMGAAAIDICHVACGRAEAYVELSIYLWDIVAADLIARRAGAQSKILDHLSANQMRYLCTNKPLYRPFTSLVESVVQ